MSAGFGITRVDQDEKRNHGWLVRVRVRGEQKKAYFADKKRGGREAAHQLAVAQRDKWVRRQLKKERERIRVRRPNIPQSGVEGVTHVKSANGYLYWQAIWTGTNGKRRTGKFSISRYGDKEALKLAIDLRRVMVDTVEKIQREKARA